MKSVDVTWDTKGLEQFADADKAITRAMRKAAGTALRDLRSEAAKRIRARKRIASKYVTRSLTLQRPTSPTLDGLSFGVRVSGEPVPLVAYPHRQTMRGVSVEVNRGKRTLVEHAFVATLASGHEGIYRRVGKARLPITELLGSRPVDALLHAGEAEAVAERGLTSLIATFDRLLPLELEKGKK